MIFTFQYPAGQFEVWTKEAAESLVGQSFVAKVEDKDVGEGKVISVNVSKDCLMLYLTIEFPDFPGSEILKDDISDISFYKKSTKDYDI